jgi:AbrB family looped-hinge helix DNA binding protein
MRRASYREADHLYRLVQVVIPRAVREALELEPGEKLRVLRYGERIELIPVKKLKEMRGFLRGLDTTIDRRPDRV